MAAGTVAGVYAAALMELARERGQADAIADAAARLAPAFDAITVQRIEDPRLGRDRAKAVLRQAAAGAPPLLADFLCLLLDRHRLAQAADILAEAARSHAIASGRGDIHVTVTAQALGPAMQTHLDTMIRRRLGAHATVRIHGDDRILGGMIVRHGDTQIDASVRRRIDDMARLAHQVGVSDSWITA